jgi:hypothetical protein
VSRYRVCVKTYVVVDALNQKAAKALAENAVRRVVKESYLDPDYELPWGDGWQNYAFQAVGTPEKVDDDE